MDFREQLNAIRTAVNTIENQLGDGSRGPVLFFLDPILDQFVPYARLVQESTLAAYAHSAVPMVRAALRERASIRLASRRRQPVGTFDVDGRPYFFPEIADAFEFLRQRNIIPWEEFEQLVGQARRDAFAIAGIESRRALKRAAELLERAIADGWNHTQWREAIDDAWRELGLDSMSNSQAERVFRTNVAVARSEAHDRPLEVPVIAEAFPFERYDAISDARSDETHVVLDGWVFLHADPIWRSGERPMRPPRRPNCRCDRTSLSVEQFLELYRAKRIRYGSGPITIIDDTGKPVRITRDRGVAATLQRARIADTGPFSGAGTYRIN